MADINITQLTSYADPKSTDELPIVDLVADVTKRVTLAKLLQNANPGTAAAPGITFDGRAANTGIYSQNDYHIGLATNGVSRVHCRENGYVGINKEAPTAPFDVVGNTAIAGDVDLASGKVYKINGSEVLSATALAGAVKITTTNITNGTIVNDDISPSAEIEVSKLTDGTARQLLQTDATGTGVEWTSNVDVPGTLDVTGAATLDSTLDVTGVTTLNAALNVSGLASLDGGIDVDGAFTVANTSGNIATSGTLDVNSEATLASAIIEDLTNNRVLIAGISGAVEDDANLTFDGTTFDIGSGNLQITAANGNTSIAGTLGVDSQSTLASAAVSDLTSGRVVLAGTGGELEDNAGLTFNGTQLDIDGNVVITGDLTVEGTSTILETETVTVEDKNIELGVVASPTDVTADGGGITLKGTTDKTINWVDATDAWTFSEHVDIASAKEYRIAGTKVLDATSLGSAVVTSSLTSVGTISSGTWQGTAIDDTYVATISTAGKVSNSATTATSANTESAIVARDASGDFSAGTITANLTGNAATATALSSARTFEITGDITGTVNSDLTSGASIATSIEPGVIVNADVNDSAAIAGTKISPDFGSQNITTIGDIDIDTGLLKAVASTNSIGLFGVTPVTQPSAIANITTTATTGTLPTADGSVTIADAAAPTVDELLEYCVELEAKLEAALAALRTIGLIAT